MQNKNILLRVEEVQLNLHSTTELHVFKHSSCRDFAFYFQLTDSMNDVTIGHESLTEYTDSKIETLTWTFQVVAKVGGIVFQYTNFALQTKWNCISIDKFCLAD
jgi:hypothetical protein